jgi:hypothetical protein
MTDAPDDRDPTDEYEELDPDQITEDALEYFDDPPGEADSPAADADAPPPG